MKSYIVEQKIAPLANQYYVFEVPEDGSKGPVIAFAHQKRFAFKEEVIFYTDDTKSSVAFRIKAENVLDIHGKFIISTDTGEQLGSVRKDFKSSLTRSTWEILHDDEVACIVRETSAAKALIRRVWGFIPFIGELPFLLKYHFEFLSSDTHTTYATYSKTTLLRDHYRLDIIEPDLLTKLNWQTLVAQAVLLDALQGR